MIRIFPYSIFLKITSSHVEGKVGENQMKPLHKVKRKFIPHGTVYLIEIHTHAHIPSCCLPHIPSPVGGSMVGITGGESAFALKFCFWASHGHLTDYCEGIMLGL